MAEKSSFFNSVSGDRKYAAEDWAAYFASFVSNGVFASPSNSLQVVISSGMTVSIKSGSGFINGYFYRNTTDMVKTLNVADGIYNRIDRIVLRWSLLDREMSVQVLSGTPASSPTAPALTRDVEIYEIALADVRIDAGVTSVVQSNITDCRSNSSLCGFVTGVIDQFDFSSLCTQFEAFFSEYRQKISAEYDYYQALGSGRYETFDTQMTSYEAEAKQDFEDWFSNLRYVLDDDVAGNLQNEIDSMQSVVDNATEELQKSMEETIEEVRQTGFSTYEHSKSGTVHSLTLRNGGDNIKFVATANYAKGDSFSINGKDVSVSLPTGKLPGNNFFIVGATVVGLYDSSAATLFLVGGGGGGGGDQVKVTIEVSDWYKTTADSDGRYWNAADITLDGFDPAEQRVTVVAGDYDSQVWIAEHGYYEVLQAADKITLQAEEVPAETLTVCYQIYSTEQGGGVGQLLGARTDVIQPRTAHVYGISWAFGNASTQCSRLEESALFSDPSPAIGPSTGSSPFDRLYPWCDMEEYNIIDEKIAYKRGDTAFSRTAYDTVVSIPKFWYKATQTSNEYNLYISSGPKDGFAIHPAFDRGDGTVRDVIYVGRYQTSSGYSSRSGIAPLVSITRATYRSGAAGKGNKWWGYDIATYSALCMLYLVEFADWNSQTYIGAGNTGTSAAINAGGTDTMTYHTGRASGTDNAVAVQYRHVENIWGNVWQFVDGINFNGNTIYFCLIPSKFADDTATNYTSLSYTSYGSGGSAAYPKSQGLDGNNPWLNLPTTAGGSTSTYIPDVWYSNSGWRILYVGGSWSAGVGAGLFARLASNASSASYTSIGGRLLFLP